MSTPPQTDRDDIRCLGIDLGGTNIKAAALDADRRPGPIVQVPTHADRGAEGIVRQMVVGVEQLIEEQSLDRQSILGVGIGAPGPASLSEGIIHRLPNVPGMDGFPLRDRVGQALDLPAVMENDANAAAFGEYLCGAGRGEGTMILLTLGTGLGSGVIQEGVILHGSHEIGAELGHVIVHPGGRECGCGQIGCLEMYCAASKIAQHAVAEIRRRDHAGPLADRLGRTGTIDAADIVSARRDGDPLAEEIWDEACRHLALGCVSICRIFDPARIVLAGGMTGAGEDLLGPVRRHLRDLHWSVTDVLTEVVIADLGSQAGAVGAAGVAWQSFGSKDLHPPGA
jgi:glucokinase